MSAKIAGLLDQLQEQITDARNHVTDGGNPTHGSAEDTLHGLSDLRCALLTLAEIRACIAGEEATVMP